MTLPVVPDLLINGYLLFIFAPYSVWSLGRPRWRWAKRHAARLKPSSAVLLGLAKVVLGPLWLALFASTLAAVFLGLFPWLNTLPWLATLFPAGTAPGAAAAPGSGPFGLGLGALIAALLGAPFLVWTTLIKQRTLALSETSLFNDKLNDAITSLYSRR